MLYVREFCVCCLRSSDAHCLVGRGPPFAYWRKVGLQAYTKICSGVLCNIVVNIVMLLHIRVLSVRLRGDNAVCVSAEQLLKICTCIASGAVPMSWAWPALLIVVQTS